MPPFITVDDPLDPRIAAYRDVRERDLVGREGHFIAEGEVVLRVLLGGTSRHRPVSLLLAEKRVEGLAPLLARLPGDVPVFTARQQVLDRIAGFPIHRGILALGRRAPMPPAGDLLAGTGRRSLVVALFGIGNHDNLGGIFRNAAAFGADAVLLDPTCCDPLYRKAIRVSVGATLLVPFARLAPGTGSGTASGAASGAGAVALLARHGYAPVAFSPTGATPLAELGRPGRVAVLLGSEGPGLPPEVLARTHTVRIPMTAGFDSLNVATASGIALHHLAFR
ncbi:MAG TPA: RNA methyltransferase [Arenibaculum sp.]|nr:RNA methyltransferase [Arenibaculum sp.]